ncbi:hypothetical protein WR25_10559 isoform D [Diploscapter pachys]|uniref:Ketoreductase domain-containing protein n=1 Tax=Diploscapter pachys TaxID=2018661 RepID=A0A2A2JTE8_9BILA|nr:hypothetical protein WR25_10559 isoform A [Diploscapter pachys]PAV64943.1 hypothetical protein WR25_10559 isoform B [Diploscapter pachys]PAV64944.1 hypothetical protein WR25_10559 isoform C [Diploscapter pachys]PAV64945.1 hypothetical protein WR25_10559 isoform D [Diploscapter pachys]
MSSESLGHLLQSPYLPYALIPASIYAAYRLFYYFLPGAHQLPTLTYKDKTVLITGASSGLGRALAIELHKHGAKLILTARSIVKLKELCAELKTINPNNPHEPDYSYLDICEPNGFDQLVSKALANKDGVKKIDVLINNAGLSMRGNIQDTPIDVHRRVMEVNFFGHVAITKGLAPHISKDGCIIVVSSVQGKLPIPNRSSYSSSKHALEAFFDCLRMEQDIRRHVLIVSAHYIDTGFGSRALDTDGKPIGTEDQNQKHVRKLEMLRKITSYNFN